MNSIVNLYIIYNFITFLSNMKCTWYLEVGRFTVNIRKRSMQWNPKCLNRSLVDSQNGEHNYFWINDHFNKVWFSCATSLLNLSMRLDITSIKR